MSTTKPQFKFNFFSRFKKPPKNEIEMDNLDYESQVKAIDDRIENKKEELQKCEGQLEKSITGNLIEKINIDFFDDHHSTNSASREARSQMLRNYSTQLESHFENKSKKAPDYPHIEDTIGGYVLIKRIVDLVRRIFNVKEDIQSLEKRKSALPKPQANKF